MGAINWIVEQIALSWGVEPDLFSVSELTQAMRGLLVDHFFRHLDFREKFPGNAASRERPLLLHAERRSCSGALRLLQKMTARYLKFKPQDGIAVIARGRIDLYEARGEVQFIVETMEPQGHGALQLAFEHLKRKLAAEGLFELSRKRAIPAMPRRIGIVTSPTGAVISDILQILERRFPGLHIRLYPALVQGEGSVEQVVAGIDYFSRSEWPDVVIVARGGGSLEDLWTFNEERVARAIAACSVPVISAVGR